MNSEINTFIHNRRSVFPKDYTGETVDDAIIRQMLENANWAPTHKFTEPWRFIVYSGEGRKKLGAIQASLYEKKSKAEGTFDESKYTNMLNKPLESSHIILVYMKRDEKKSVPEMEELGSTFMAVQNMYLTASANKVGAYLSTGGPTFYKDANEAFGLGPEDKIIGFFHVGMPKRTDHVSRRNPIEAKVQWVNS
ncbi:MAG TPA: nitroreductase [Cyclobacteriaceae bacterium]|nr:nitroreductase [Cyclobacteriaceae bacterium]HMV88160.1 nitroreductase [Cyclobacteriaceae bacterium]HMW99026.1 nitroreductase [Cyclobacteriaceae bacterium]HMX48340.1 nitroreductase [Cyclobacteriaceae bacterium]HMY95145.1 nitroreductase [Cyclobacteriaceae bacterium]